MTIVIAGEKSGVGKTTITLAILAYLCDRAVPKYTPPSHESNCVPASPISPIANPTMPDRAIHPKSKLRQTQLSFQNPKSKRFSTVQSFKVGPDYIDPMFHTYVTGRPCRNLDPVLTSEKYVQQCFEKHRQGTDYSIVEGVMGLFDGASGADDTASTAHIARLLDIPIVLVLDCSRLSRSVAAIIHGYTTFDPRLNFAGVILNRVGSDRHLHLLKTAIEPLHIPILGVLRRATNITIPDRHLGLIPTDELPALDKVMEDLRAIASTSINWDLLLPLLTTSTSCQKGECPLQPSNRVGFSSSPQSPPHGTEGLGQSPKSKIRIAIARDRAFNFYYADNFDSLEQLGATLVFWSPLSDLALPQDIHGLYLGGGFPEVFASELAANNRAKASVKTAVQAGLPTYAECGGLMYLCESIVDFEAVEHSMVGLLPTTVQMGKRLSLGYREAIAQHDTPVVEAGEVLWGHEFHRSHLRDSNPSPLYELYGYDRHTVGSHHSWEGWSRWNLHASYVHVHWGDNHHIPQRFLVHCQKWATRYGQL